MGVRMMNKNKECRCLGNFEVRQIGEGEEKQTHIQGYALTFDTISEDMGFREMIQKGALDDCDLSDVIFNFNHSRNLILARNNKQSGIGSLILTVDSKGLFFDAVPTNTSYARDLISNMESGIVGKCSFTFDLDWRDGTCQTWDWDDDGSRGYDFRTIHKIAKITDVSVVTSPAYESTSSTVYKRYKEEYLEEVEREKEMRELKTDLELIELENELL